MSTSKTLRRSLATMALICAALPASALSVFDLSADGSTYGTVSLTQVDSDTVHLSVVLASGYKFNDKVNQEVFDFNLDLTGPTLTNISPADGYSFVAGSNTGPVFGAFDHGVDCRPQVKSGPNVTTTGCKGTLNSLTPSDAISFDVNHAGISEASFIANAKGYYFFALVNHGTDPTFQVGSNVAPIPEPETYALMLAGLGVVGFVARRRKTA